MIWDLSGNVWEWVKDNNNSSYGAKSDQIDYIIELNKPIYSTLYALSGGTTTTPRSAKDQFGPMGDYLDIHSKNPFGNLGIIFIYRRGITLARGGNGSTILPLWVCKRSIQCGDAVLRFEWWNGFSLCLL